MFVAIIALACIVVLPGRAIGQTLTWTGGYDGSTFSVASNWSPAIAPGASNDCVIPAGVGTVTFQSNATVRSISTSRALVLDGCSRVTLVEGLTLNNGVVITIDNTGGCAGFCFEGGTHSISGNGQIFIKNEGFFGEALFLQSGANVTIQSGITVTLGPGAASTKAKLTIGSGCSLTNFGTIASRQTGSSLTIDGLGQFTNNGTLESSLGGTLIVQPATWSNVGHVVATNASISMLGNWSNPGDFMLTNAAVTFDGTYSSFGNIQASGGTVLMQGNFTGTTLTTFGGDIRLGNMTMNGTTLRALQGAKFVVVGLLNLSACTIEGNMTIDDCSRVIVINGLTLTPGTIVGIDYDCDFTSPSFTYNPIDFSGGTQTLAGAGTIRITRSNEHGGYSALRVTNGATLTINPEITIDTDPSQSVDVLTSIVVTTTSQLINYGTIAANRPYSTLILTGSGSFSNFGTISASPGSKIRIEVPGTNVGTIQADHANLELAGLSDNAGTILASASRVYGDHDQLPMANHGVITLDSASQLLLDWDTWINEGQLIASDATISIRGLITSVGTIAINNSTCGFDGHYASLGTIVRSGGTLTLRGYFEGPELVATSSTGDLILDQLSMTGVTLRSIGTGKLLPWATTLTGCTIASDLAIKDCHTSTIKNGLTLANGAVVSFAMNTSCTDAEFYFSGGVQTLGGNGTIVCLNGGGPLNIGSNTTLTIGSGVVVRFGPGAASLAFASLSVNSGASLINEGRIENLQPGRTMTISGPGTFLNHGTLAASAGTTVVENIIGNVGVVQIASGAALTFGGTYTIDQPIDVPAGASLTLNGVWTNTSSVSAANATLVLGGTWTNSGVFAVNNSAWTIGGTYASLGANTGQHNSLTYSGTFPGSILTADASTGDIALKSISLKNKTLRSADGAKFVTAPNGSFTLDGCILDADITVQTCGSLAIANGLVMQNGAVISLANANGGCGRTALQFVTAAQSITGDGVFRIDSAGNSTAIAVSVSVTFAPGIAIRVESDASSTTDLPVTIASTRSMVVQGTLFFAKAGRSLLVSGGGSFLNQGTVECRAGTLSINPSTITNYTSSTATLSGGIWKAKGGAILLGSRPIRIIASGTDATLDGASIGVTLLSVLTTNAGSLHLAGQTLTTTPVGGTFTNSGTLELGVAGKLAVNGSVLFQPASTVRVVAGGTSTGQFGSMTATASAALGGSLTGAFVSPYIPAEGDVLTSVVRANVLSGSFSSACFDSNPALLGVLPILDLASSPNVANLMVTSAAGLFPTVTSQPINAYARPNASFEVVAGPNDLRFAWRRNGQLLGDGPTGSGATINGASTNQLSILLAQPADAGDYDVLVSNGCGTTTSQAAALITCRGDLNGDGLVDDADFTIFVTGYNILDCADPAMPPNCPADINGNGVADDEDFTKFVVAYNELLCP